MLLAKFGQNNETQIAGTKIRPRRQPFETRLRRCNFLSRRDRDDTLVRLETEMTDLAVLRVAGILAAAPVSRRKRRDQDHIPGKKSPQRVLIMLYFLLIHPYLEFNFVILYGVCVVLLCLIAYSSCRKKHFVLSLSQSRMLTLHLYSMSYIFCLGVI